MTMQTEHTPQQDAGPAHRTVILGAGNVRELLQPFQCFERDRAYYEHCRHYDGDHGVPGDAFLKPQQEMHAIQHYLDLKLADFSTPPGAALQVALSENALLTEPELAMLHRFNAWLLQRTSR